MSEQTNARNLETAIALARSGAFIFPAQGCGPGRKKPCNNVWWKHVASCDILQIRAWWWKFPDAVPAINLVKSGLLVIDCDCKLSNGLEWLTKHASKFGDDLSAYPAVDTPSGGRHLYFRNTIGHGDSRGQLPPKEIASIDVKGAGYAVAPGSIFADGGEYSSASIFSAGLPPQWLVELLSAPKQPQPIATLVQSDGDTSAYGSAALNAEAQRVASAPEGERNNTLNSATHSLGQLSPHILSPGVIAQAMESAAQAAGLPVKEARATIRSGLKAGMAKPRGPTENGHRVNINLPIRNLVQAPDGTLSDSETGETIEPIAQKELDETTDEIPDELTRVPGLVGDITDWIVDTAIYPQRGLSLGAALVIVGTAAGRHLALMPNLGGTHLYVIGLAPSGAGKDHPLNAIQSILIAAGLKHHVGPSQFISMPAVVNFLMRSPLSVCAMDEFGSFLKRINSKRASGFEGAISGLLRSAWGKSFKSLQTPEWAGKASETICSPSLSIFGVSTQREFYSSLEGADITNGVLNRFILLETSIRPKEQRPLIDVSVVPEKIIRDLDAIYNRNPIVTAQLCQSSLSPPYDPLWLDDAAEEIRHAMAEDVQATRDANEKFDPFLARVVENATRIATIATIGMSKRNVDAKTMWWARDLAQWSAQRMAKGAGIFIADSEHQAMAKMVVHAIEENKGRITRTKLYRRLDHRYRAKDIDEVIKSLMLADRISTNCVRTESGSTTTIYMLGVR